MSYQVLTGDCLDILPTLKADSIDAIVTDPPYGLSFMGKAWDNAVPSVDVWRECLRVLKPGGHLLCFAGTRTQHRMASAIEDAGFDIRDMIAWVYGSGFPKSLDVSKAIDKQNGRKFEDRYELGWHIRKCRERMGVSREEVNARFDSVSICNHWEAQDRNNARPPIPEHWERLKKWLGCDARFDELVGRIEAEREVVGQTMTDKRHCFGNLNGKSKQLAEYDITAPATPEAQQWQGWGTALKPALEPITVARKPISSTVAANVLQHGTGAINIDSSRVKAAQGSAAPTGRWPSNFIHDGSDEVTRLFPVTGGAHGGKGQFKQHIWAGNGKETTQEIERDTGGSAARFFYCAKASKRDRDEGCEGIEEQEGGPYSNGNGFSSGGDSKQQTPHKHTPTRNHHPTVKPTALMSYLVRLVTPPGGVVLDPFMGSGSTGKAAAYEGFGFVGCELDPEYIEIAKARIKFALDNPEDDTGQPELFG